MDVAARFFAEPEPLKLSERCSRKAPMFARERVYVSIENLGCAAQRSTRVCARFGTLLVEMGARVLVLIVLSS